MARYRPTCRGCYYLRPISATSQGAKCYCHYMLFAERSRPCPAEACTVKTRTGPQRRKAMTVKS